MSLKLRHDLARESSQPGTPGAAPMGAAPAVPPPPPPTISGWLGVLATMLPRRQAESVREELETHLQDRVRDLMVGGLNEAEATRRAIAELGEAAELAAKYRALSNEPRRRLAMYGAIFAVAGAALALSISAVSGGRQPEAELAKAKAETEAVKNFLVDTLTRSQPERETPLMLDMLARRSAMQPQMADLPIVASLRLAEELSNRAVFTEQPAAPEIDAVKIDVKFEETPAADVFQFLEATANIPVQVNWKQLESSGLKQDTLVTLRAKAAGVDVILRAINESPGVKETGSIDWRVMSGVLVVGLRDYFDRREIKLAIYDLDGIIAARQSKYNEERPKIVEEVVHLVTEFVYPEGWRENGGEIARLTVVGDRMFVDAPERFHKQIKWMLDQLPGQGEKRQGDAGGMDVQRYAIKHIGADEALKALKGNQAIKAIDFSNFTVDVHTNSVLGKATPEQHAWVQAALGNIDVESAQVKAARRSELMRMLDERRLRLEKIVADRKAAEHSLAAPDVNAPLRDQLQEVVKTLKDQEAACQTEVEALKAQVSSRSEQRARVYLTGAIKCPGAYVAEDGLTLRRLLAAAGGITNSAVEVTISESADGKATVSRTVKAAELNEAAGPDPDIRPGQLVSVR